MNKLLLCAASSVLVLSLMVGQAVAQCYECGVSGYDPNSCVQVAETVGMCKMYVGGGGTECYQSGNETCIHPMEEEVSLEDGSVVIGYPIDSDVVAQLDCSGAIERLFYRDPSQAIVQRARVDVTLE